MKKLVTCLLLTLFSIITLIGGSLLAGCDDNEGLINFYNEYLVSVNDKGGTPVSYEEWLELITGDSDFMKGDQGDKGDNGLNGDKGETGLSAYELYKKYHPAYKGTEEEWINDMANGKIAESYKTNYNFIYTVATIPPVLSSLECIKNGYPTYAYIERGKTYNGIDNVDNFYNLGFNTSNNTSDGFTNTDFNLVLAKIKELNVYGNEKFNIYVQDGTALYGAKLVGNARLTNHQYKIVMIEDGTGAYDALKNLLTDYNAFVSYANTVRSEANEMLSKNDNTFVAYYDIEKAFALATMDNFEFLLQSKDQIQTLVTATGDSALSNIFGFTPNAAKSEYDLNLRYDSISDKVTALSQDQKEDYLNLMYGDAYQGTYDALTRTTDVAGQSVPDKKLVFIGTRVKGYPAVATDTTTFNGVGALTTDVPTYANLSDNYKDALIFGSEANYQALYNVLFDDNNYQAGLTETVKNEIRKSVFNYYINYIATLKFTYAQYGAEYDIIMKGHPREVMDSYEQWGNSYTVSVGGHDYAYDKVMFNAIMAFHQNDTVGKRIGLMPYGTAAENLAYLGLDIAIGGLPSSTYTGYDTSVDVLFVLNLTNGDITTDGNLEARYQAGNLIYHDSLGVEKVTKFYNIGLIYKTIMETSTNNIVQQLYAEYLSDWIKAVKGIQDASGYTVNDQGAIVQISG